MTSNALVPLAPVNDGLVALTSATTDEGLLETWLHQHTKSAHTHRAYVRIGRRFLQALRVPMCAARLEDFRAAFVAIGLKENGEPAAASSRATNMAVAKSFSTFAARVGYTQANLGELFKLDAVPTERAQRILNEPDVFVLLRQAEKPRDALLLEVAYYGGLRVSELVSLTWRHLIDRENGLVQISGLVGKGGKAREVLLPANVGDGLRAFRNGAADTDPVFRRGAGHGWRGDIRPMSVRAVRDVLTKTARAAKLKGRAKKVSPHWLRHAHASHALDAGAPIGLVSQTLGHASLKTTSVYVHAKPGDSSGLYLKKTG